MYKSGPPTHGWLNGQKFSDLYTSIYGRSNLSNAVPLEELRTVVNDYFCQSDSETSNARGL